jgi:hypothetical protein
MRSSEVYFDDTGKIRIVYAPDDFTAKNIEIEKKLAAEAAKANKQARLQESRQILKFYNQLQRQQQTPQQPLLLLEQSQQQQSPKQQASQQNNSNATSKNILKHLQLMRKIGGMSEY